MDPCPDSSAGDFVNHGTQNSRFLPSLDVLEPLNAGHGVPRSTQQDFPPSTFYFSLKFNSSSRVLRETSSIVVRP
jgi:hypothetical protein